MKQLAYIKMKFILTSCLMLLAIYPASSLRCWMCMGSTQSDCSRAVEESMTIQDCDETRGTVLAKTVEEVKAKVTNNTKAAIVTKCVDFLMTVSGSQVFTRGCGWIYETVDICEYMAVIDPGVHACVSCNENLCNTNLLNKD